jgi:hypothetical protein
MVGIITIRGVTPLHMPVHVEDLGVAVVAMVSFVVVLVEDIQVGVFNLLRYITAHAVVGDLT